MSEPVKVGDVVQLDPEEHTHHDGFWAGQLLLVTEVKSWGVQGYAQVHKGRVYYRAENGTFKRIGHAAWMAEEEIDG